MIDLKKLAEKIEESTTDVVDILNIINAIEDFKTEIETTIADLKTT